MKNNLIINIRNLIFVLFAISFPLSVALSNIFIVILSVLVLSEGNFRNKIKKIKESKWMNYLIFLIISYFIFTIPFGLKTDTFWTLKRVSLLLVLPLLYSTEFSNKTIKISIFGFLLSMFISSIIAIAYNYEILQNPKNFTWSAFLQYTEHNVFLAFALIISIYTIIRTKINRNFNMIICLFISVFMFSIFTEGGKSGQIVFVFSSILLAFLYFRKKLKILFVSISSILLFSFIIYNTSDIVKHRFDFEIKNIKKGTDSSRKILLSETIKLIKANPIFGYGTGSFTDEFAIVNENTKRVINQNHKTPHNNYLYVYFELGLIGFALLLLVFYHQTKELYIKTDGNFLIIFPFMFLVIMFTDSYLYQHNTLMLYLFMSIAVSNYQYKPS